MNKSTKSRITTVAAGAALLAVFGGGSAVAGSLVTSAQIKDNTIRSVDVLNGTVRSLDIRDNSVGTVDVRDGSLTGADVRDGTLTNADINVFTASVNQDGTLIDHSGGVVVAKQAGTGNYSVDFGRNIKTCAFIATAGGVQTGIDRGVANVSDKAGNSNAVFVETNDLDGTDKDMDFHLAVIC